MMKEVLARHQLSLLLKNIDQHKGALAMTVIKQFAFALTVTFSARHARQLLAATVAAILVTGSLLVKAQAAAGALDPTFSGDGRQTTKFNTLDSVASAVAVQADGKIVAVGFSHPNGAKPSFAITRYLG